MRFLYSAFLLAATLAFSACSNDDDVQNVTPSGPYASLGAVLNTNGAPAQTFNIDADTGGVFMAARGSKFFFPPRGFVYPNGEDAHGTVEVTVQEFLDRGEFIFSRNLPVSGGVPLLTAGAFFTAAKQSNRAVKVRATRPYTVFLPQRNFASDASGLQPFFGSQVETFITSVLWGPATRPAAITSIAADTIAMEVDTLGYHQPAAGQPYFGVNGADATVKFNISGPGGMNQTNSLLFVLPKRQRQVIYIGSAGDDLKKASFTAIKDREINIVGVAVVNGYFYGGTLTTLTEDKKTYTVNLSEVAPAAFKAAVNALL